MAGIDLSVWRGQLRQAGAFRGRAPLYRAERDCPILRGHCAGHAFSGRADLVIGKAFCAAEIVLRLDSGGMSRQKTTFWAIGSTYVITGHAAETNSVGACRNRTPVGHMNGGANA